MYRWTYAGPVCEFKRIISNRWTGSTIASTEARARTNLAHQFKKEYGKSPRSNITLPGKLIKN